MGELGKPIHALARAWARFRWRRRLRRMGSGQLRQEYARVMDELDGVRPLLLYNRRASQQFNRVLRQAQCLRQEWDRRWHYQLGTATVRRRR